MRKLYVTANPFPTSDSDLAAAQSAGAAEIVHVEDGYPEWLTALGVSTTGYHEIAEEADTLEGKRAAKRAELEAFYQAKLAAGFAYDFGGSYGVLHMQLRDADDKANWDIFYGICNEGVAAGAGGQPAPQAIRTAENINVTATYAEGQAIMQALRAWAGKVMSNGWAQADAIEAASDPPSVDLTAGWP